MSDLTERYINEYVDLENKIKFLSDRKQQIKSSIYSIYQKEINTQLADKNYNCGTANITVGGYKLKFVVTKKVDYDQSKLANIYDQIIASGESPSDYMVIKYDVAESKYKAWPAKIQDVFNAARTVKASPPTLTVEIK